MQAWSGSTRASRSERNERLIFWSTGEIRSRSTPNQAIDPDGLEWKFFEVGQGGLIGRVDASKRFDIGARTHLIRRDLRDYWPEPLWMPRDGVLFLGIKGWTPGAYQGTFAVSIWRHQGAWRGWRTAKPQ